MSDTTFVSPVISEPLPRSSVAESKSDAWYGWIAAVISILTIRAMVFAVGVWSIQSVTLPGQIDHQNASGRPWLAFDGGFYYSILLHGYPPGPAVPYQIAYFPLYPYIAKLLMPFISPAAALLTVSNLCSLIGLTVVYGWARSITNARTAFFSTMLLAMYPGAVFYCASLTEGLFVMLVAIIMYLLTERRLWTAAIVCGITTACRPTAVALCVTVFLWTIFNSRDLPWQAQVRRAILIGMISIVGGASYQAFIWHRYQRFDAYKVSEDKWEPSAISNRPASDEEMLRKVSAEWQARPAAVSTTIASPDAAPAASASTEEPRRYSLAFFVNRMKTAQAWNRLITVAMMLILVAAVVKRSAVPRLLLLVPLIIFLMSYLPNAGLRASSILRYESAGVPLFVVLGYHLCKPKRQALLTIVLVGSMALELYYAFLFSRGCWIG